MHFKDIDVLSTAFCILVLLCLICNMLLFYCSKIFELDVMYDEYLKCELDVLFNEYLLCELNVMFNEYQMCELEVIYNEYLICKLEVMYNEYLLMLVGCHV